VGAYPADSAQAPEILVGGEQEGEVGAGWVEIAVAERVGEALEVVTTVGEQICLCLPARAIFGFMGHGAGQH
jgi:hypothetical protein